MSNENIINLDDLESNELLGTTSNLLGTIEKMIEKAQKGCSDFIIQSNSADETQSFCDTAQAYAKWSGVKLNLQTA